MPKRGAEASDEHRRLVRRVSRAIEEGERTVIGFGGFEDRVRRWLPDVGRRRLRDLRVVATARVRGEVVVLRSKKPLPSTMLEDLARPGVLMLRPVLAEHLASPPQRETVSLPPLSGLLTRSGETVTLADRGEKVIYVLGPASVVGHVERARIRPATKKAESAVVVTLDSAGARDFDRLASQLYAEQPPRNTVAIVVDDVVIEVPHGPFARWLPRRDPDSGPIPHRPGGLAAVLNRGPLPVGLAIDTTVGRTSRSGS